MRGLLWAIGAIGFILAGAARAEVVDANSSGFQVKESIEIAAPAIRVWNALSDFGYWWNGKHSWSGDAMNLNLELKPGGCLCETLPDGGGVRHMSVIFVAPGKTAILDGALGPLIYSGATGRLVWSLAEKDGRTTLTQTYYVGGYYPGGLDKLAPAVDGVLTEQLGRLKSYLDTGRPTP